MEATTKKIIKFEVPPPWDQESQKVLGYTDQEILEKNIVGAIETALAPLLEPLVSCVPVDQIKVNKEEALKVLGISEKEFQLLERHGEEPESVGGQYLLSALGDWLEVRLKRLVRSEFHSANCPRKVVVRNLVDTTA